MEESEGIAFDNILFERIWNIIGKEHNFEKKKEVKRYLKNNFTKDNAGGLMFESYRGMLFDIENKDMKIKEQESKYKDIERKFSLERAKRLNGAAQTSSNTEYYKKKMKEMQEEIDHYRLINQLFCATMPGPLKDDIKDEFLKKDKKKNYRKIFLKHCENTKIEFPFENYVASKKKLSLIANKKDSDEEDDIPMPPNITVVSESESEDEEP